jgi:hypothetical protein
MPAPTLTGISPSIGAIAGGQTATLTGTNFTGTTGVTFGGVAATNVTVVSATEITCVIPAGSLGVASVLVTNGSGTNGANSLFFYIQAQPTDTYIYLRGGRGDGFVPEWTGVVTEVETDEKSDPYRNIFPSSKVTPAFSTGSIGGIAVFTATSANGFLDDGEAMTALNLSNVKSRLSDEVGGITPRQFDKATTWLVFLSANGLTYEFRKDLVIGRSSQPRDSD